MAEDEPDWGLYRTFVAVFRERSLSAAARHLAATQPTVGRQIGALEAALGAKLFTRSRSGLMPTPLAQSIFPHAQTMSSAAALLRRASQAREEHVGTVRLTAGGLVALEIVPGLVAGFVRRYPQIAVEYSVSRHVEDLLEREADVAVRMTRPSQAALVARRVATVKLGLFAHRAYAAERGLPSSPRDSAEHCFIGFDRDAASIAAVVGTSGLRREDFKLRTDDVATQLALLRAGAGIGACPLATARLDPELVPVFPDLLLWDREVWIVMHPDQKDAAPVRLLADHLADGFAAGAAA